MEHPEKIVALKVGVFYKLFFEDAKYFRERYNFLLRNLAAPSSAVAIESCGFPVRNAEKYQKEVAKLYLLEYARAN